MSKKIEELLHGGDYNPEQWLNYPRVIDNDFILMKEASINTITVGMFSWSSLEPEEGKYTFDWLDDIFERMNAMSGYVILGTPSGARPAWLSHSYPEVLRTDKNRQKHLHGGRHNHCYTSPIYRKKTKEINEQLAKRYGTHPALAMWHISNELSGECHCDLCQHAFRTWLKEKYDHNLDKLNHAWWTTFWSHQYTDWDQIESPSPIGEHQIHGLNLDWKRFVTHQTIDFFKNEREPLKENTSNIPVTTNFMAASSSFVPYKGLDYSQLAKEVDIISWDAYPKWHNEQEKTYELASKVGFMNDLFKSLKQKPWLLMESTPSMVNWHEVNKPKKPGLHYLSGMQMLAHGSDSNLYFQWRKSRGSFEKFHGAVLDHDGSEQNRVYKEVSKLGKSMKNLSSEIVGTKRKAKVALLYDWESDWALEDAKGFGLKTKNYVKTLQEHYQVFWEKNIPVDVITKENDFSQYSIILAPMLYLVSEEMIERLRVFVKNGGYLVSSYLSGYVDEYDLAYLGEALEDWWELLGVTQKELDVLYPSEKNQIEYNGKRYEVNDYASFIELKHAKSLSTYTDNFYADTAAVTENEVGIGKVYYIGARAEYHFHQAFYNKLIEECQLKPQLDVKHNIGVSIQGRLKDSGETLLFIMNFTEETQRITINEKVRDLEAEQTLVGIIELKPYEVRIVKK